VSQTPQISKSKALKLADEPVAKQSAQKPAPQSRFQQNFQPPQTRMEDEEGDEDTF
jgi:hypothetical protein